LPCLLPRLRECSLRHSLSDAPLLIRSIRLVSASLRPMQC